MRPETENSIRTARHDAELEAAVGERIARAGAREAPPADDLAIVRAAAREAFRETHGTRRPFLRRFGPALAAVAALLVVAVGVELGSRGGTPAVAPGTPAPSIGRVALLHGDVRLEGPAGALAVGAAIRGGATLESSAAPGSGIAVRLDGGAELRVDASSRVRFETPSRVRLERGAVYFDSGFLAGDLAVPSFEVETAAARFRHVGTQFEIRVDPAAEGSATRLRVREGRVRFGDGLEAAAGEEVVVDASGRIDRASVPSHGPEWSWVAAVTPIPDTESWDVVRFLDWLGRESGRRIEFADPRLREEAAAARLHGGLGGLTPGEAAEVVLASSGLVARATDGVLRIEDAKATAR